LMELRVRGNPRRRDSVLRDVRAWILGSLVRRFECFNISSGDYIMLREKDWSRLQRLIDMYGDQHSDFTESVCHVLECRSAHHHAFARKALDYLEALYN